MSREWAAAMRRSERRLFSVRSPAIRRTLLSRHRVAVRTFVRLVDVGRTSALGHARLRTPASGPVIARTVASPFATFTVTCPAVMRAGVPHDPLLSSRLTTWGPATVKVYGTENVARRDERLRQELSPNFAPASPKSNVTPVTGRSSWAAMVKLTGLPVTGVSGTI